MHIPILIGKGRRSFQKALTNQVFVGNWFVGIFSSFWKFWSVREAEKHTLFAQKRKRSFGNEYYWEIYCRVFAHWGVVHATRTLLSEAASQMLAAAGQFFSGLITTKRPVEKNSEGLWGKRWGVKGSGKEGRRRVKIRAFEKPIETHFHCWFHLWWSTQHYQ